MNKLTQIALVGLMVFAVMVMGCGNQSQQRPVKASEATKSAADAKAAVEKSAANAEAAVEKSAANAEAAAEKSAADAKAAAETTATSAPSTGTK
jgi:uncharacterized lipoprotein NlpE involved in copper resistance